MLTMEYALKYHGNLQGLIITNMMSSIPEYEKYAKEVLGLQLPPGVLKDLKDNSFYQCTGIYIDFKNENI